MCTFLIHMYRARLYLLGLACLLLVTIGCEGSGIHGDDPPSQASSVDTDEPIESITEVQPIDCSPIQSLSPDWELCYSGEDHCEAVYSDQVGCDALCASVGL